MPFQHGPMLGGDVLHVPQPVVDEPVGRVLERRPDAAAAVVADDDDVLDLQDVDRVLKHRETVEVGVHDDVRDVPVDEQLAGRQVDDLVRRHATVGAPDPQVARRLLCGELPEEARLARFDAGGPGAVAVEEMAERRHGGTWSSRDH